MVEVRINARPRPSKTASYKHDMREKGMVPAIVYGKGIDNQPIEVGIKDLESAIQKKGRNALIDLVLKSKQGDNKYVVMVKEIQRDPIKREIVHVDLCKISLKDKVHTTVPVTFKGEAKGLIHGGIVQSAVRELDIECMPAGIPETITVDISGLDIGEHLTVGDLPETPDYKITTDPEAVLVTVVAPRTSEPEAPASPAVSPAAVDNVQKKE